MLDFLKSLGLAKFGTIIGVTAGVLVGLMLIIFQLATPPMSLLFSDLSYDEAGQIMQRLDQSDVPYRVDGNGTMIFAPKDQVLKLRMDMAQDGLPTGGTVGYEIFDNTNALNTTSFVQDLNRLRALEGELARTISSLRMVDNARVHLVIPERALFSRDKQDPTASIVISARGGLSAAQVQAVRNLVASAVPNLSVGGVSIVDESGVLLAAASNSDDPAAMGTSLQDRTASFETRLRRQVENIVASIVGPDKVRVQISAEMDFNRVVEQSETFDPEGQVARSTQTVEESTVDAENGSEAGVSVTNNLPETDQGTTAESKSSSTSSRLEETVNFEISRMTKTETQEAGRILRLSAAVVVDGSYTQNSDGSETYQPRSEEELQRITALVRSAIGYSEKRGDSVEVLNLEFVKPPQIESEPVEKPLLGLGKEDYMRIGEIIGAVIVGIILMLVLKNALTRASTPAPTGQALLTNGGSTTLTAQSADGNAPAQLAPPQQGTLPVQSPTKPSAIAGPEFQESALAQIDMAQIEGKVKDSSVKKVGELVSSHPEESLAILRGWLHEA